MSSPPPLLHVLPQYGWIYKAMFKGGPSRGTCGIYLFTQLSKLNEKILVCSAIEHFLEHFLGMLLIPISIASPGVCTAKLRNF